MDTIATIDDILPLLGAHSDLTANEQAVVQQSLTKAAGAVRRHLRYDPVQATRTEFYPQLDLQAAAREGVWEVEGSQAVLKRLAEAAVDELQVRHIPVRSITSLRVDYDGRFGKRAGSFGASTAWTEGTDFWADYDMLDSDGNSVCRDGILRSEGRWPNTAGSVKIVYIAGYTAEEITGQDASLDASPIWEVVIEETMRRVVKTLSTFSKKRLAGFAGPLASESLGDYSYSADTSARGAIASGADLSPASVERLNDFVRYDLGVM